MKKVLGIILSIMLVLSFATVVLAASVQDGTYVVETKGMYNGLKLSVTFTNGKITEVKVLEHQETAGISDLPIAKIPAEIVANNSVNIDTIAGATRTSAGILDGVKQAILLAGGNIDDFMGKTTDLREKAVVELETDVVVAGAGMAGLTAALSAAEHGYDVILLEKMPVTGGSLAVAGGGFITVNSPVYARLAPNSPKDTLEDALTAFTTISQLGGYVSDKYPNVEKVKKHFAEFGATHEWLEKQGVVFSRATAPNPGKSLGMLIAQGGGLGVAQALTSTIQANDRIDLYLSTPATKLIAENGKVTGVIAESDSTIYHIKANYVILATGGFASNPDMIAELVPAYVGTVNTAAAGSTGDGIRMAVEVGAKMYDEHWMVTAFASPTQAFLDINRQASSLQFANRVLVNEAGKRFVNEADSFTLVTNAIACSDTKTYAIFDSTNERFVPILETGLDGGNVFKGNTIEELAKNAGIDSRGLVETIMNYNQYAAAGNDPEFNKAAASLVGYADEGPYYAVEYRPSVWGSMSGVVTDEYYRVLNTEGSVIEGLYAIGEVSNKEFYNRNYQGGASLSFYSTMGRLVGGYLGK